MSSVYGLKNELLSLEKQLEEAQKNNDTEKICYLKERVKRVKIEIENLNFYNKST